MSRLRLPLVVLCSLLALVPAIPGQTVPLFSADSSTYDLATGEAVFTGNVRGTIDGAALEADEVRYNRTSRTALARGNVLFHQGKRRLLADELRYHVDTAQYQVVGLRLGSGPMVFSGAHVTRTEESLTFENARLTYGEPGRWAPTLVAERITYSPDRERVQIARGRLGIGWWQPIPLVSHELPTDIPFLTYLTVNAGLNSSLGAFLETGLHLPLFPGWNLGADLGLYTKRGLMFGPSGNYTLGDPGYDAPFAEGNFSSGFIRDVGDRLTDLRGDPVPRERGFASWRHNQRFTPDLTLTVAAHYWSDSEVLRDFRSGAFFPVQTPDSFVELQHTSPRTVLGLFLRAQPNPYHQVAQRLPELTFNLLPTPLPHGLVHRAQAAVAVLRDDPPAGGPGLHSERADLYYALTRPMSPREWLSLQPVVGARVTHYNRALGNRSDYTRTLGEFGLDAEARLSGTFDYQNPRWGIDGLRHLVTPRLSYRYIPRADRGQAYIPPIDRNVFSTYLEPLSLGERRQIDDLAATNTLRLALGNRLQTRDPAYGSRDLAAYTLAADLHFDRPTGAPTVADIHSDLRLTPASWIAFELYHRFAPDNGEMLELNTALVLRDADLWTLRLSNHYLNGDIQEYIGEFRYRLNEVYAAYTRQHFDVRRSRFVEQTFGLSQVLGNRWIVGYEVSFYDGPRRESDFSFNFLLEAVAF